MATYTIETTVREDVALKWVAEQPGAAVPEPSPEPVINPTIAKPDDPDAVSAAYLDARVHEILAGYITQYDIGTSLAPPADVAYAYAAANAAQQAQILGILEMPVDAPTPQSVEPVEEPVVEPETDPTVPEEPVVEAEQEGT